MGLKSGSWTIRRSRTACDKQGERGLGWSWRIWLTRHGQSRDGAGDGESDLGSTCAGTGCAVGRQLRKQRREADELSGMLDHMATPVSWTEGGMFLFQKRFRRSCDRRRSTVGGVRPGEVPVDPDIQTAVEDDPAAAGGGGDSRRDVVGQRQAERRPTVGAVARTCRRDSPRIRQFLWITRRSCWRT